MKRGTPVHTCSFCRVLPMFAKGSFMWVSTREEACRPGRCYFGLKVEAHHLFLHSYSHDHCLDSSLFERAIICKVSNRTRSLGCGFVDLTDLVFGQGFWLACIRESCCQLLATHALKNEYQHSHALCVCNRLSNRFSSSTTGYLIMCLTLHGTSCCQLCICSHCFYFLEAC